VQLCSAVLSVILSCTWLTVYAVVCPLHGYDCRGAHAAAVVYDITSPESFEKAKYWISELQKNASGSIGAQRANSSTHVYSICILT
jgi:hypothetical protein